MIVRVPDLSLKHKFIPLAFDDDSYRRNLRELKQGKNIL